MAEIGTIFNVFSYDTVRAVNRTHHLPDDDYSRVYAILHYYKAEFNTYELWVD